ncbi:hypothetical protein [Azohydromonas aeria]|uniref:hypothetical protein n=1 Tax=Azohydromonas aeria TaxID=2590212 RepID=UPI0012FB4C9C|nr:hypothetical protein [Azohydromonas aeria]
MRRAMGWLAAGGVLLASTAWAQGEAAPDMLAAPPAEPRAEAAPPPPQAASDVAPAALTAQPAAGAATQGALGRVGAVLPLESFEPQLLALWRPAAKPVPPPPVPPLLPPEEAPLLPPAPYAAPSVWSAQAYKLVPDKPLAALRIYAARPRVPLKETAFTAPLSCNVDPFASLSTDERQQQLRKSCGRDQLRLGVDGSRVVLPTVQQAALLDKPPPASPQAPARLELDQQRSEQWSALDTPMTTSVRLGWQGSREGRLGQVSSDQRALLATGSLVRLGPDAMLDVSVGRQRTGNWRSGEIRTRTAVTGLWRPLGEHMVYAQWADEATGIAREVGLRWWLQPGRVALDVGARRNAEGQLLEPRVSLSMSGFLR